MSKKTKTFITSAIILFILVLLGMWFFFSQKGPGEERPSSPFDFFGGIPLPGGGDIGSNPDNNILTGAIPARIPTLRQLSTTPTAGATVLIQKEGAVTTKTTVRFMERATGNIYDIDPFTLEKERVTNTTIPKVHEALWGEGGKVVLVRYLGEDLETIETFSARVRTNEVSGAGSLAGEFFPKNIKTISLSPDASRVFYMQNTTSGVVGITADLNGDNKKEVFSSPVTEWAAQWATDKEVILSTKPSSFATGYSYSLNLNTGLLTKILGGFRGLTVLGDSGANNILASASAGNEVLSFVYDLSKKSYSLVSGGILTDKCAWDKDIALYCGVPINSSPTTYPDEWYQGKISFRDAIVRISPETGAVFLLAEPEEQTGAPIDTTSLVLSEDGGYLVFINKNDSTLWGLDLNPED